MFTDLQDVRTALRFLIRLPGFLRRPVTGKEAEAVVRARLASREKDFLATMAEAVFPFPQNPFRRLLELAGCQFGDLERLVQREGVEGALQVLYREGVYLTADEFKGRAPARRGSSTIEIDPEAFRNPHAARHIPATTGGSRAPGAGLMLDLTSLKEVVYNRRLGFDVDGAEGAESACWTVPGSGGIVFALAWARSYGCPPTRWFSQIDVRSRELHARFRLSAKMLGWSGKLVRVQFPEPTHVAFDDPMPIVEWLASVLRSGGTPYLGVYPAAAVGLARAAVEAGVDLRGAIFSLRGEPVTPSRVATLEDAGVRCTTVYGTTECSNIAHGCTERGEPDETHLFEDLHAMIQVENENRAARLPAGALLMSSIRPTARQVLLNVSMGDRAVVARRDCGCPLERLGLKTHLHTIRSFEKLTGVGMSVADADVAFILEKVLPGRFGGSPIDWQLLEHEAEDGTARLSIVAHPRVGRLEESAVVEAFLAALGERSDLHQLVSLVWKGSHALRLERRPPSITPSGKILHFRARGAPDLAASSAR